MALLAHTRDVFITNALNHPVAVSVKADKKYSMIEYSEQLRRYYTLYQKQSKGSGSLTLSFAEVLRLTAGGNGSRASTHITEETQLTIALMISTWDTVKSGLTIIDTAHTIRFSVENAKNINYISILDLRNGSTILDNHNTAHHRFKIVAGHHVYRLEEVHLTKIVETQAYGKGREHFAGWQVNKGRITGLRMRAGGMIDAMEVHVDGVARRGWGGGGGHLLPPFILAHDEDIVSVTGRFGDDIKWLKFETNKGRVYQGGDASGKYAQFYHRGIRLKDIDIVNGSLIQQLRFKFEVPE
eukprot:455687_1